MTHTPAPWIVEPDARAGSITVTHTDGHNRSHIAVCPQMTLCEEHGSLLANARLIAAAPDLLDAILKSDDAHWTPAMRSAIWKATQP